MGEEKNEFTYLFIAKKELKQSNEFPKNKFYNDGSSIPKVKEYGEFVYYKTASTEKINKR